MKYYGYSGKKSQSRRKANKKRLIINIVIIASAVILSVTFALLLGNHLKKKLEEAPISHDPIEDIVNKQEVPDDTGYDFKKNDRSASEMAAVFGYLDLEGCPDAASARKFVSNLKTAGYTGVVFSAKGVDGNYSFASEEAYAIAHLTPSDAVVSPGIIAEALAEAESLGMRSAAYIDVADAANAVSYELDRAVIRELCSLGFSEIIIDGAARGDLTPAVAISVYGIVGEIRRDFPECDVGLVIDPSAVGDAEATSALEIMFRYSDFFALDFSDRGIYTADAVKEFYKTYEKSVSVYSALAVTGGGTLEEIRSAAATFSSFKPANVAFVTARTDAGSDYASKLKSYSLTEKETEDTASSD